MTRLFVVPCGAAKLDHTAPARYLYTGHHFRFTLRQVETHASRVGGQVRILSALHGLIQLDARIAPYDLTMGAPGSIRPHDLAVHLDQLDLALGDDPIDQVHAFLPNAYLYRLEAACRIVSLPLINHFADAPGIGYQRQVLNALTKET